MSAIIGDPRPAGEEGPAGDQREAGTDGPAGDPRPAGEQTTKGVVASSDDKPAKTTAPKRKD